VPSLMPAADLICEAKSLQAKKVPGLTFSPTAASSEWMPVAAARSAALSYLLETGITVGGRTESTSCCECRPSNGSEVMLWSMQQC
jgi:hypothetical protein